MSMAFKVKVFCLVFSFMLLKSVNWFSNEHLNKECKNNKYQQCDYYCFPVDV